VSGVFATVSKAYDDVALRLPIDTARRLLKVRGSHTWVILLNDTSNTDFVLDMLRKELPATLYEITPWWQLSDFYNKSARLFSRQAGVMKGIIALLIVLSISNTLMMSVLERTGEIGTSMALGSTRSRVMRQFVSEAIVTGTLGALLGIVLGVMLAGIISVIGIPVPPPPGMGHGYIGRIQLSTTSLGNAAVLAIITTTLAALYPAWKASRLPIVDALRRNR
jgi:putative ABC transport system permease protein